MEASARMDELRAKLAKPKPATPDKWEPDDHPHAIWCSYYGPDDAMQSTNTLSYIAPAAQENRFDLTLAGAEATDGAEAEGAPSDIASIGLSGCAPAPPRRAAPLFHPSSALRACPLTLPPAAASQPTKQQVDHRHDLRPAARAGRFLCAPFRVSCARR